MFQSKLFFFFLFVFSTQSCSINDNVKNIPVIIKSISHNTIQTDTTTLSHLLKENKIVNKFGLEKTNDGFLVNGPIVELDINTIDTINVYNHPAYLVSTKTFGVNKTKVRKYYYDIKDSDDEEGWYFIASNRLIAFYSRAWDMKDLYLYEDIDFYDELVNDTIFFDTI